MTHACSAGGSGHRTNHLAGEKSPYLLQHAGNPVDWYPWGDEAFELARRLDRPIFLSIGYATCHWCHVMERESFEDPIVASLMNDGFVNIKVDREERPDIDQVYMTICQMITGSGGWPLTILMTPDRRPFYAATYIPRTSRMGRPGMLELLPKVQQMWRDNRTALVDSAGEILAHLESSAGRSTTSAVDLSQVAAAVTQLGSRFDAHSGGFGSAPKFPSPHTLILMLRHAEAADDAAARDMVIRTLDSMRAGGVYDQIGFGFHRYSTDSDWRLPHFEKMLYDQAMHLLACVAAFETTREERFAATAREIMTYVLRDMTGPEGGFYSAEDADSEGEEGRFYVWTTAELREVLGDDDAEFAARVWGAEEGGNFADEASGHHTGANVLFLPQPLGQAEGPEPAPSNGVDGVRARIEQLRETLLERREQRVHPLRDDKILADWNGLMSAAAARAGRVFDEPAWTVAAASSTSFVDDRMRDDQGRLLHRYRDGEAAIAGFLDDAAMQLWASLELYDATFDPRWLKRATGLATDTIDRFHDPAAGGFFFAARDAEALLVRQKDAYDGAIPSGNSVMATCLVRLSRLTGRADFDDVAGTTIAAFGANLKRQPSAYCHMLQALMDRAAPSLEVVIAGRRGGSDTAAMLDILRSSAPTSAVVLIVEPGDAGRVIRELALFVESLVPLDGRATAYVCRDFACQLPTTNPVALSSLLADSRE